jgi:uncharacterized membrane protein YphA (DoxX/SURF4 family)
MVAVLANDAAREITGRNITQMEVPDMLADPTIPRSRGQRLARLAAWVPQLLLAAAMLGAGAGKLAGTPDMVALFEAVGVGQWFRVLTGLIEVAAGLLLLVPRTAGASALLLVAPTMTGAILTELFIRRQSPGAPLVLLAIALTVAWLRRDGLRLLTARTRGGAARRVATGATAR